MPKNRTQLSSKAHLIVGEFSKEFCVNQNSELFCILCHTTVNCDKRFRVTQHRESAKHLKALRVTAKKPTTQTFIPATKKDFKAKLVESFLSADIPLHKLQNPKIRGLFTDLGQSVPSESACRGHVQTLAASEFQRIKDLLRDKTIFMVIDESEISKTKYLNVLVGDTAAPEKTYFVDCSVVQSVNQAVIAAKVDDTLWNLGVQRNNFLLLLSDAASYMTACTEALQTLYSRLFHVTCTAHLLHNCSEKVRSYYADVDNLIARTKAATVKNKSRRTLLEKIGSPPEPVVTRWGSWLTEAFYYADILPEVQEIVNNFHGDGIIVSRAKEAVNSKTIAASLVLY